VIGVQAVAPPGFTRRPDSSYGDWVDISAPGEGYITTTTRDSGDYPYTHVSSDRADNATSDFAAALVAGVVASMLSVNPDEAARIQDHLCREPFRPAGVAFDRGHNDYFGCGVVNFETAVERMPWKLRVGPRVTTAMTAEEAIWMQQRFTNPYLNRGAWRIVPPPGTGWMEAEPARDMPGGPSWTVVNADMVQLQLQEGSPLSGRSYTESLQACPDAGDSGVAQHQDPSNCVDLELTIRIVERLDRLYLPLLGKRTLPSDHR
jgi:hypothetical protein